VGTAAGDAPLVTVGFNRRFAPLVVMSRSLLAPRTEPKSFVMTVNAGAISPEHWPQNRVVGGGQIVGEACHFIDLPRHLCARLRTAPYNAARE
jgi:predicted dehydrogenase